MSTPYTTSVTLRQEGIVFRVRLAGAPASRTPVYNGRDRVAAATIRDGFNEHAQKNGDRYVLSIESEEA